MRLVVSELGMEMSFYVIVLIIYPGRRIYLEPVVNFSPQRCPRNCVYVASVAISFLQLVMYLGCRAVSLLVTFPTE